MQHGSASSSTIELKLMRTQRPILQTRILFAIQTRMTMVTRLRITAVRWGVPALLLCLNVLCVAQGTQDARPTMIRNESGHRVVVHWVTPGTGELVLMSDADGILTGSEMLLNSYVSHEFQVTELPKKKTSECETPGDCLSVRFAVTEHSDQSVTLNSEFALDQEDNKVKARKQAMGVTEDCRAITADSLNIGNDTTTNNTELLTQYLQCVGSRVEDELVQRAEEVTFQAEVRRDLAKLFEKYTCLDDELESSEPIREEEWYSELDDVTRDVKVLHDRPASRIHIIEGFIDDEECQAMEDEAQSQLARAVVSDGAGGSTYSENRKAMQAGITVPWEEEENGHPIARISRRVYMYANHVLGLDIDEHGQENLMSIQYKGKGAGLDRSEYDQYTPHCDGDCTGDPHRTGTRVATMVLYCTVPSHGGATNFRASGLHVHPIKGNAIFFSYMDPVTKIMDAGFTEHSGCPVMEGEKKIVTQWIRLGVDDEHPWDSFDTLGRQVDDDEDDVVSEDEE